MSANFTELQIVNKALARLAVEPLTSPTENVVDIIDNTVEADLVKLNYALIRDTVTEDRIWTFAVRRVTLDTPSPIEPNFGFANRFLIPADALSIWRIFRIGGSQLFTDERLEFNETWTLEDQHILTDLEVIFVQYLARLDSANIFKASAQFIDALSIRLAAELCIPLTENRTLAADLFAEYQGRLTDASSVDGSQGTREIIRANSLINIRNSSFPTGAGGAFNVS